MKKYLKGVFDLKLFAEILPGGDLRILVDVEIVYVLVDNGDERAARSELCLYKCANRMVLAVEIKEPTQCATSQTTLSQTQEDRKCSYDSEI